MFALAHDTGSFQKANGPYLLLPDGSALLRRNLIPTLDKACFWRRRQLTQKPSIILPDPDGLLKGLQCGLALRLHFSPKRWNR